MTSSAFSCPRSSSQASMTRWTRSTWRRWPSSCRMVNWRRRTAGTWTCTTTSRPISPCSRRSCASLNRGRLLRGLARHSFAEALCPASDAFLLAPPDGEHIRFNVLVDDRAGADDGSVAHDDGGNEGGIGTDEGALANHGLIFRKAVVIAGDRACADVGSRTDRGIAYIREVIHLRACRDVCLLELDEIAHLGLLGKPRSGTDPSERANARLGPDGCTLDMAECVDSRAVGDTDAGTEDDMRLDRDVAAELRVVCEPDALRVDQGRPLLKRLLAASALPLQLEVGELDAAIDPCGLIRIAFDYDCIASFGGGDVDDIGEVVLAGGIVVADLVEPPEEVIGADGHHAGVAEPDCALLLRRILKLDHFCDMVAVSKDDPPVFQWIGRS